VQLLLRALLFEFRKKATSDWLRALKLPDFPVRWDAQVLRYLDYFKNDPKGRSVMSNWLRRAGRYREMFDKVLVRHGLPRDIFYLEVEEVLGYVQGYATCTELKGLVALRRREFESYAGQEPPPERFETVGLVHHGNRFRPRAPQPAGHPSGEELRRGLGCGPGMVSGRARVIFDPRTAALEPGDILVAERTDPGWVTLFPLAAGLIVERGSLLSHSAIVAREMGLPTVVALEGATTWLSTGDPVRVDGNAGCVWKLHSDAGEAPHALRN